MTHLQKDYLREAEKFSYEKLTKEEWIAMRKAENGSHNLFVNMMLTSGNWNNPSIMKFTNAGVPVEDVEFGTMLNEIIDLHKLPMAVSDKTD
ncbi:MAG: hypothetical protein FWE91_08795 [Defluviitaleaceae bacterium]|nr:hypothetical protein [Defluviitaleaceae bacterium]MCL2836029.1 hypothetical protein [Defluviitaleaceae bacterium]